MKRKLQRPAMRIAAGILALSLPVAAALAAGGGNGGASGGGGNAGGNAGGNMLTINNDPNAEAEYAQAQTAIAQADYQSAIDHLNRVLTTQPNNPDVLNLMGFSKRKTGDQTSALAYYDKALSLQPNHIGANEYLGELYLELKQPAKAQERLDVLQQACGTCEEYNELKEKIEKYKATQG